MKRLKKRKSKRSKHIRTRHLELGQRLASHKEATLGGGEAPLGGTNRLIPQVLKDMEKIEYPMCDLMKKGIIPSHPSSTMLIGGSGSGKTTCLLYMIKHLMKDCDGDRFFTAENTYLFSFSGKSDPSFAHLGLDEDTNIFSEDLIDNLDMVIDEQREEVEAIGLKNAKIKLLIFEDVTGSKKFINSKNFTKSWIGLRHIGVSVISCSHKYSAISRVCRLSCSNIMIFPSQTTEKDRLRDDHGPPSLNKKNFNELVEYAWTPEDDFERPFLYINMKKPFSTRFRKGFHQVLEII